MSFHEVLALADRGRHQPKIDALVLQRKCGCGTHARGAECEACRKKRTALKRSDRSRPHPAARIAGAASARVPEGVPMIMPGQSGVAGAVGALASGIRSIRFQAREGGARAAGDPLAIRQALGPGRPLDSAIRSRMQQAFGQSFTRVRTHTDSTAALLSAEQNARAFTVGRHVAFGAGQYRPGTPVGDALIAHELAHVMQQHDASAPSAVAAADSGRYGALEKDADRTAARVIHGLWRNRTAGFAQKVQSALPALSSGLRLQRCDPFSSQDDDVQEKVATEKTPEEPAKQMPSEEPVEMQAPGPAEEPARDAGTGAQATVTEAERNKACTSAVSPDKVILSHTAHPTVIEKPGDTVTFKVTFACKPRGDGYSKLVDAQGNAFGRQVFPANRNEYVRTWDGKKAFPKVGTYLVDDGTYQHRMERFKYAYRAGKDLLTSAESDSPRVEVKARAYHGPGSHHAHYSKANVASVAKAVETEMGGENATAKKAVAWAIRNQMIRLNIADASQAIHMFRVRSGRKASGTSTAIAEEILKKPMSDDITGGAIKWFSPNAQPKEGDSCEGEGCGGGLDTFTDTAGKRRRVHTPAFHKHMTYVPISGIHEWRVRFYKL